MQELVSLNVIIRDKVNLACGMGHCKVNVSIYRYIF